MDFVKVSPQVLRDLFCAQMYRTNCFVEVDGVNPFRIKYNGEEMFIYIKNLSPAQLSNNNPDIWRIQLPVREEFDKIKDCELKFILLGYDFTNDIFATWNPYFAKQRLNVAKSVSFYSRLHLQRKARKDKKLIRQQLNNDGEVLLFPREMISEFLLNISTYFPDETEYIAMGSRRRPDANKAYAIFTNKKNINDCVESWIEAGFQSARNYRRYLEVLFNEGLIAKYRRIFLNYDNLNDYGEAIKKFVAEDEVAEIEVRWHNALRAALNKYLEYLSSHCYKPVSDDVSEEIQEPVAIINYEELFTSPDGKLTKIANPILIQKLKPYLSGEYKNTTKAYNEVKDFYKDRFPSMTFVDWMKLLSEVRFEEENSDLGFKEPEITDVFMTTNTDNNQKRITRSAGSHLKIILPDGEIIEETKAIDSLVKFVIYVGAEYVNEVELFCCGVPLLSKERDSRYGSRQKDIGDGWLLMTNSSTETKKQQVEAIAAAYGMSITVEIIT